MFSKNTLLIKQTREMFEVVTNFETANRYIVYDDQAKAIGHILEKSGGFWELVKRNIFGSHRSFEIHVYDENDKEVLILRRPFYFFFSNLSVYCENRFLGRVRRRFRFFSKRYDFEGPNGNIFASIHAGFFRIWKFPIVTQSGREVGDITKKWRGFNIGGILTEAFTDADTFLIQYGQHNWSLEQKKIILAAAISVDFDHFENNKNNNIGLGNNF